MVIRLLQVGDRGQRWDVNFSLTIMANDDTRKGRDSCRQAHMTKVQHDATSMDQDSSRIYQYSEVEVCPQCCGQNLFLLLPNEQGVMSAS